MGLFNTDVKQFISPVHNGPRMKELQAKHNTCQIKCSLRFSHYTILR